MLISFIITNQLYKDQMFDLVQDSLIKNGKTIIEAYTESEPANRDVLINGISSFSMYSVRLYDQTGELITLSNSKDEEAFPISQDVLHEVLNGAVFEANLQKEYEHQGVGLPFTLDGNHYALFIKFNLGELGTIIGGLFKTQLFIVLICGALLIVLSVRYIVRPIQHLTRATKEMAKGDFNIHVKTNRKDEIGQLTTSFNHMAHELGMLEKIRRQFVSDVSHEIQSPLTSIKGFTQALKNKKMDEATRIQLLEIIESESNRLSRLSEGLLQLSTLEYEHLQLNKHRFRLDEQIRNVIISLEPQWSIKQLAIDLEIEEIFITADEDKLNQIWANLIGNSIKFTEEHGNIQVRGRVSNRNIQISIIDSGAGIEAEELHDIFKPFYKVDKSRDTTIGGNGIGLSIVKRIIELHHSQIHVESKVGEGTTFTITFPNVPI